MRFPFLVLVAALASSVGQAVAQGAQPPPAPLTLAEAERLAESAHPLVRAREAQLAAAEGARREAAPPLFNNPELSAERARRRGDTPDSRTKEWGVGIAQTIETGGQQARRRDVAAAAMDALRAEIDDARRQARADAALRFHAVLAAQQRVRVEQRSFDLLDETARGVGKRRAAGEDTRLDANLAAIEAERARNALMSARERLLDVRGELATVLQWTPSTLPEIAGDLALPKDEQPAYSLEQLLDAARGLPRQRAWAARVEAARARVNLERASRAPDVTVGLNVGRDGPGGSRERVTGASVSVPLPIFKRNDAAIGQAVSEASQAEIERTVAQRDAHAQIQRLFSRLEMQRERVLRLQRSVAAVVSDNQQLAAKSRQAGQIGLLDQLLVNRQALDAERELGEALAEYHATRVELEHAAGWAKEGKTP